MAGGALSPGPGRPGPRRGAFVVPSCSEDAPHPNPPAFVDHPLREEQRRSLAFMVGREEAPEPQFSCGSRIRNPHGSLRGGVLADASGCGKTATTIGLIACRAGEPVPDARSEHAHHFESRATLVLAPSHLLAQWRGEFKKFFGADFGALKIVVLGDSAKLCGMKFGQLAEADVVIATPLLFSEETYKRRTGHWAGMTVDSGSHASFDASLHRSKPGLSALDWRIDKKMQRLRQNLEGLRRAPPDAEDWRGWVFPTLEVFHWHRVVIDEFHEIEAWTQQQRENARHLCSHYRWGLSATPPVADVGSVTAMMTMMGLISDMVGVYGGGHSESSLPESRACQAFIDRFVRQSSSALCLPRIREHVVEVVPTSAEQLLYEQACRDADLRCGGAADSCSAAAAQEQRAALLRLCSHCDSSGQEGGSCGGGGGGARGLHEQKRDHISAVRLQLSVVIRRHVLLWRRAGRTEPPAYEPPEAAASGGSSALAALERAATASWGLTVDELLSSGGAMEGPSDDKLTFAQPLQQSTYTRNQEHRNLVRYCVARLAGRGPAPAGGWHEDYDGADFDSLLLRAIEVERAAVRELVSQLHTAQRGLRFLHDQAEELRRTPERECSFCLETVPVGEFSLIPCSHFFHSACLHEALRSKPQCPTCRLPCSPGDVRSVELELASTGLQQAAAAWPTDDGEVDTGRSLPLRSPLQRRHGSKLHRLANELRRLLAGDGHARVVLFCQWEALQNAVRHALQDHGVDCASPPPPPGGGSEQGLVDSGGPSVEDFQQGNGPRVLVLSRDRCASGSDLTIASHVFFVHPMDAGTAEQAMAFEQEAIGRVRCCGQARAEVHVWHFVTRGTVEEELHLRAGSLRDKLRPKGKVKARRRAKDAAGDGAPVSAPRPGGGADGDPAAGAGGEASGVVGPAKRRADSAGGGSPDGGVRKHGCTVGDFFGTDKRRRREAATPRGPAADTSEAGAGALDRRRVVAVARPRPPAECKMDADVATLVDMGFDDDHALDALRLSGGDLDGAVARLLAD